ncbi:ABC transporter ATP-binding protein [Streptomyces sp. NPDC058296]|uniref:ABC transporter ATP-binding protein n=1 Tax=Streptomyces sp. NPDC058296 TaxID=3346432 RepID=UPI0036E44EBA
MTRLLGLLQPRRLLLAVTLFGLGSIVLNVSGPVVLGAATDVVFDGVTGDGVDSGELAMLLCVALALYTGSALCWILQGRLTTRLVQGMVFRLRRSVDEKLTRLPLAYLDARSRGEVLSRTTNDVDNIAQSLQQTVSQVTNSLLLLVGVVAMMLWISPLLASVALVAVPLCLILARFLGRRAQEQFKRQWAIAGELSGHAEETLSAHAVVTVFGRQQQRAEEFRAQSERLRQAATRAQFVSGLMGPSTMAIGNVSYVLVAVVGALQMSAGNLSIGSVQAFVQYSRQFTQPLMSLSSLASVVQSGIASAERVFTFLDAPEEEQGERKAATSPRTRFTGRVDFSEVCFRYEPDEPLIEDFSLTVEPGSLVAIVGPTGAGKTTLVNLLVRFYDVTAGRISLDGTDIRAMHRDDLRSAFGMVLQDTWVFSGTIHDNIAYGKDGATAEEVIAAARLSHADHFIRTLPDGCQTVLDGNGSGLPTERTSICGCSVTGGSFLARRWSNYSRPPTASCARERSSVRPDPLRQARGVHGARHSRRAVSGPGTRRNGSGRPGVASPPSGGGRRGRFRDLGA